jgi:hypothetical protein
MAIKNVPINLAWNTYALAPVLAGLGFKQEQGKEILCCYDVLRVWRDKFEHLGELVSLDHLSGVDDPPDVIAHFSTGATLDMEHTSIEPNHRHWGEKLRGGQGGVVPPVGGKYKSRDELLNVMNPWGGGGWASVEQEAVARCSLILDAMRKKIKKHPPGGIMVLDAHCHPNDLELPSAIAVACDKVRSVPGSDKWTYSFISRSNHIEFYSTIFSPTIPYEVRRPPPPDVSKISKFSGP